jgi:hypothetical protein
MELAAFTEAIERMTPAELHDVARSHARHHACPADEVDAFRAFLRIEAVVRQQGRSRDAARAARAATRAVSAAADAGDILLPDPEVTLVARAAAVIARGLVAGPDAEPDVAWLLLEWSALFDAATAPRPAA